MKTAKKNIVILLIVGVILYSFVQYKKYLFENEYAKVCLNNIKMGKIKQMPDPFGLYGNQLNIKELRNNLRMADFYSEEKKPKLSELIDNENLFITFCDVNEFSSKYQLKMVQEVYNRYKSKINFIFITEEKPDIVNYFFKKENLNLPIYSLYNGKLKNFGVKINPTSHLTINNNYIFQYGGIGYFNNDKFYNYIDSALNITNVKL